MPTEPTPCRGLERIRTMVVPEAYILGYGAVGTGTVEQNGTSDMMGNVYEWVEEFGGVGRVGGCQSSDVIHLSRSFDDGGNPTQTPMVRSTPSPACATSSVASSV